MVSWYFRSNYSQTLPVFYTGRVSILYFGNCLLCSTCGPNDRKDSGDNRTSSSGCTVYWCCVLAGCCSPLHQEADTDPTHQPLLAIFYEERNSSNVKVWEWHSTKPKQSATLNPLESQSQVKQERPYWRRQSVGNMAT